MNPSDKMKKLFGTTEDPMKASWILSDGSLVLYKKNHDGAARDALSRRCPSYDCIYDFQKKTGAIRIVHGSKASYLEIVSNKETPTEKQMERIDEVCRVGCNAGLRDSEGALCEELKHTDLEAIIKGLETCRSGVYSFSRK